VRLVGVSELRCVDGLVLNASGEDDGGQSVGQLFPADRLFREAGNVTALRVGKAGMEPSQVLVLPYFLVSEIGVLDNPLNILMQGIPQRETIVPVRNYGTACPLWIEQLNQLSSWCLCHAIANFALFHL